MSALVTTASAQITISYEGHGLVSSDTLVVEQVDYTDAGPSGENVIWDFSGTEAKEKFKHRYAMSADSLSILFSDKENLFTYSQDEDSLILLREEDNLSFINYDQPVFIMNYPMVYGDVCQRPFHGEGMYSGWFHIRRMGTTTVEADGIGTLIRAEGDTLRNVLRVHTVTTASLWQNADSIENVRDMQQQEITESYRWFVQGLRHPAYETTVSTYYSHGDPFAMMCGALRFMAKPLDVRLARRDKTLSPVNDSIFSFQLTPTASRVTMDYELTTPAKLRIVVADAMGMLYRNESFCSEAGIHQYSFDCIGLKPGQYIVYINVNGIVYNSKFTQQ